MVSVQLQHESSYSSRSLGEFDSDAHATRGGLDPNRCSMVAVASQDGDGFAMKAACERRAVRFTHQRLTQCVIQSLA